MKSKLTHDKQVTAEDGWLLICCQQLSLNSFLTKLKS